MNIAKAKGIEPTKEVDFAEFTLENLDGIVNLAPEDAVDFFRTRVPLRMRTVESLVKRSNIRSQAVAKQVTDFATDVMEKFVDNAIDEGHGLKWFIDNADEFLDSIGLGKVSFHHLETVFRTNMTSSYTAGRWAQLEDDPVLEDVFSLIQFNGTADGRQSEVCQGIHGKVWERKNTAIHPWIPPNHYRCRTGIVPLTRQDAKDEGLSILRAPPVIKPEPGFKFNGATSLLNNATVALNPDAQAQVRQP